MPFGVRKSYAFPTEFQPSMARNERSKRQSGRRVCPRSSDQIWGLPVLLSCLLAAGLAAQVNTHAQRAPKDPTRSRPDAASSLIARNLPPVIYRGGPYLRRPRIVTITFKGDDTALVERLRQFGSQITRTRWWREVTAGYCGNAGDCVGSGRTGTHVRLDEVLPENVRDVDVESLLTRKAVSGRLGTLDADTLLLVYLPARVGLSDAFNPRFCNGGPRAYHRSLKFGDRRLAYAVIPRCGGEAEMTATASHEILEGVTNPDPSNRGFAFERNSRTAGFTAAGIEPVDPCGLINMNAHRMTLESGFVVQRAWSNRTASLGRDPCVPTPRDGPYLALIPRQPAIRLSDRGESAKIVLDAEADRTVTQWEISALDLAEFHGKPACVEVSLDREKVTLHQTATLSVKLRNGSPAQVCVVALISRLGDNTNIWPLAVVVR